MAFNLAERRIYQEFKNTPYIQNYQSEIQKISGAATVVEPDWASLENTDEATWVLRDQAKWVKTYWFSSFEEGLKKLCVDDMGKQAFSEKVKKIVFVNSEDTGLTLENGVFTQKVSLRGNGIYDGPSITDFFEKNL